MNIERYLITMSIVEMDEFKYIDADDDDETYGNIDFRDLSERMPPKENEYTYKKTEPVVPKRPVPNRREDPPPKPPYFRRFSRKLERLSVLVFFLLIMTILILCLSFYNSFNQQNSLHSVLYRLEAESTHLKQIQDRVDQIFPRDCLDVLNTGVAKEDGVQDIFIENKQKVTVWCDITTDGGGWTVFQRRGPSDHPPDFFYRNFSDYIRGFGDPATEFWLGLEAIRRIALQDPQTLRIDVTDFNGISKYAEYTNFTLDADYQLFVGGYTGSAGDALAEHVGRGFSTFDHDRDGWATGNCAEQYTGAWWFNDCLESNLNGLRAEEEDVEFGRGVIWSYPYVRSFRAAEMKMRKTGR